MIVLEVHLNGKLVARAGARDMGVLGAHVMSAGKLGPASGGAKQRTGNYHMDLWVGGLTSRARGKDEHLRWGGRRKLKVGDQVFVRVLEAKTADRPNERIPQDGTTRRTSDRERFEFARTIYFKLRSKFERRRLTTRSTATRRKRRAR